MTGETCPENGSAEQALALHYAITYGDLKKAQSLLDDGVCVNVLTRPSMGWTALMDAAFEGSREIVELLLDRGADLELRDPDGSSALDIIDYHMDEYDLAALLLARGARRNPDLRTRQDELNEYYDAVNALQSHYHDDRTFVYEICRGLTGSVLSTERQIMWSVIGRRNVHHFPPVSITNFDTYDEAVEFYRMAAAATPRVSLGDRAPKPIPTWDEHLAWLTANGWSDPFEPPVRESVSSVADEEKAAKLRASQQRKAAFSKNPCLQEKALRAVAWRRIAKPGYSRAPKPIPSQPMLRLIPSIKFTRSLRYQLVRNHFAPIPVRKSIKAERLSLEPISPRWSLYRPRRAIVLLTEILSALREQSVSRKRRVEERAKSRKTRRKCKR